MKKVIPAAGIVSFGLMLVCSNALGQGESPGSADTKTAATAPYPAKGSVEVKLTEYKIEMAALIGTGATTFNVTNTGNETPSELENQSCPIMHEICNSFI